MGLVIALGLMGTMFAAQGLEMILPYHSVKDLKEARIKLEETIRRDFSEKVAKLPSSPRDTSDPSYWVPDGQVWEFFLVEEGSITHLGARKICDFSGKGTIVSSEKREELPELDSITHCDVTLRDRGSTKIRIQVEGSVGVRPGHKDFRAKYSVASLTESPLPVGLRGNFGESIMTTDDLKLVRTALTVKPIFPDYFETDLRNPETNDPLKYSSFVVLILFEDGAR